MLRYAATLHDVGKLGVPTRLLRKTERLDDEEFEEIRLHPSRGVEVVRDIAFLDEAYSAILHHHERMDGLGYPSGLRGMRIPPFARIIAVADAFDSMTSTRSYRGARGSDEALTSCAPTWAASSTRRSWTRSRRRCPAPSWPDARGAATAPRARGRGGQPELAELPPGGRGRPVRPRRPRVSAASVDIEGAEKPQTDDYAPGPGSSPAEPLPEAPEYDAPESDAAGFAEPGFEVPESDAPESDVPESDVPESEAPVVAPREELRLGPFRPELNLPAQAKRMPRIDRDAPTNTGPETEGR